MTRGRDAGDAAALAVLMALRIHGRAAVPVLARVTALPLDDTSAAVDAAIARSAVRAVAAGDAMTLAPAGEAELAAHLAAEAIDRDALVAGYESFLAIDAQLKTAISAWQLAGAGTGASGRDVEAERLRRIAARAARVVATLASVASRLDAYRQRFVAALAAFERGDGAAVASPRADSLHQVWFELHEDLLVTLGRTRAA